MTIWALADLHLAFGVPSKTMDVFGGEWIGYAEKIKKHWLEKISPDDLVLIAGDISWALRLEDAAVDLQWIHALPGTKVMIRGNHDYWWNSLSKIEKILPPSIHLIQNNVFNWKDVTIGGARLWDTPEYSFSNFINYNTSTTIKKISEEKADPKENEKIFQRELLRLEMSLKGLNPNASFRIAMTHYPPIGANMEPSRASQILDQYGVQACIFGHLHNVKPELSLFGKKNKVHYYLTSCDYLNFEPVKISK